MTEGGATGSRESPPRFWCHVGVFCGQICRIQSNNCGWSILLSLLLAVLDPRNVTGKAGPGFALKWWALKLLADTDYRGLQWPSHFAKRVNELLLSIIASLKSPALQPFVAYCSCWQRPVTSSCLISPTWLTPHAHLKALRRSQSINAKHVSHSIERAWTLGSQGAINWHFWR
jgi:hypothetical protein